MNNTQITHTHELFVDTLSRLNLFSDAVELYTDVELLLGGMSMIRDCMDNRIASQYSSTPSNMDIFRSLRDRHLKWMAVPRSEKTPNECTETEKTVEGITEDLNSDTMITYSFIYAVMHIVDPTICVIPLHDRDRCILKFVDRAVIGISSDSVGLVKRFRKATCIQTPTIADMTSTLYDSTNVFRDDNINDIAVFYITSILKIAVLIVSSSCTKLYPQDASVSDITIIVSRVSNGGRSFCIRPIARSHSALLMEAYRMLVIEWWQAERGESPDLSTYLKSLKCKVIRDIMKNRLGIATNKQMSQIHALLLPNELPTPMPFKKNLMITVMEIMASSSKG
jgi:hypothetical protein